MRDKELNYMIFDFRKSKSKVLCLIQLILFSSVLRYGAPVSSSNNTDNGIEGMSVTFNNDGSLLYALRRRLPPVIFKFNQPRAFCQFDAENYVNLCTMKAGCFVGDRDQVDFSYI